MAGLITKKKNKKSASAMSKGIDSSASERKGSKGRKASNRKEDVAVAFSNARKKGARTKKETSVHH